MGARAIASLGAWSRELDPGRRWRLETDYLTVVCAVFTGVTLRNSGMMLIGWDEPKTGVFAYVHLLSRLVIISVAVAVFYLGDLYTWIRERSQTADGRRFSEGLHARFNAPLTGFVSVFTLATVLGCLALLGWGVLSEVSGGAGLYRNLLLLAAVLTVGYISKEALDPRTATPRSASEGHDPDSQ